MLEHVINVFQLLCGTFQQHSLPSRSCKKEILTQEMCVLPHYIPNVRRDNIVVSIGHFDITILLQRKGLVKSVLYGNMETLMLL